MYKIAIVGNIAAGKSIVERIIASKGYCVLDSDKIAHDLMAFDKQLISKIKNLFKDFDVLDNGKLSRDKIGKIVFYNQNIKTKFEKLIHPEIIKFIEQKATQGKSSDLLFVSVPLLFEVNWQHKFDKILFIAADDEVRLKRLIERNNYSKDYALKRIKSQNPQKEKINLADFVVYNNSDIKTLTSNVENFIESICLK